MSNSCESTIAGKICSIKVKNFVTYSSVVFHPGDNLNIIIGANGTGKSTLVAAIVLGMGGNPKLLSRSGNIEDYVKNGENDAEIHVGLYSNINRNKTIFSRYFDVSGKSIWSINNETVNLKVYLKRVQEYNIQIGNLCQFLPQDRVQDFTKMNPQELLENTQNSVCNLDVINSFSELKELREKQKTHQNSVAENQAKLTENIQRNEAIKGQIQSLRERNKLQDELDICNKKKAWLEFEELFIKYRETEEDLKKAKENESQAITRMRPLIERSNRIDQITKDYESKINQHQRQYQLAKEKMDQIDDQIDHFETQLNLAKSELNQSKQQAAERETELNKANVMQKLFLQDLKCAIEKAGSERENKEKGNEIDRKIGTYKAQINELFKKQRSITQQLEMELRPQILTCNQKIEAMENTASLKLDLLQHRFDHVYQAVLWLRNNEHLFRGKVYEPMIIELNVRDNRHAKYFENLISIRDLISFTCEDRDDMALLFKKLRNEMKLNVNFVHSEPASSVKYRPSIPIESLRAYGCSSYLLQLIDGPVPILNYLCRMYKIHMVPIGSDQTFNMSEEIPKEISLYFTPNHRFSITYSKYSGKKSSMSIEISGRNLLSISMDGQKLQQQKELLESKIRETDKLKNDRIAVESQVKQIDEKCKELVNDKQRLLDKFTLIDNAKEKLKRQNIKIKKIQEMAINVELDQKNFLIKAKKIVSDKLKLNMEQSGLFAQWTKSLHSYELLRNKFNVFKVANVEIKNQIKEVQEAIDRAKKYVLKITEVLERYKTKCKEKKHTACQLTDGQNLNSANFKYKSQFDQLPGNIEDLVAKSDEIQGRIDCIVVCNENVQDEYRNRKQEIDRLQLAIANFRDENDEVENNRKRIHDKWYPEIIEIVQIINRNFSTFMASMGYAGEVELIRKDERDYNDYGIEIRVQYRNNEKLKALDRFVQSGGERAVAIAVFTLSLQHISNVPFRCVDEINQGMDPHNERKIFNMLVEQTSKPGKCQYFFVTPKLLPNLIHNSFMTIHIVHNAPFVDDKHTFERVLH